MKTRVRRTIKHALDLQPRDLTALWKFLQKSYKGLKIAANCADGSLLETQDLDELLGFENPSFRRIQSVEISEDLV